MQALAKHKAEVVVGAAASQPDLDHPVLAIGSPAPDFNLPGIDGKNHTLLLEYSGSAKLLAIVFESNHCPASIGYEGPDQAALRRLQEQRHAARGNQSE